MLITFYLPPPSKHFSHPSIPPPPPRFTRPSVQSVRPSILASVFRLPPSSFSFLCSNTAKGQKKKNHSKNTKKQTNKRTPRNLVRCARKKFTGLKTHTAKITEHTHLYLFLKKYNNCSVCCQLSTSSHCYPSFLPPLYLSPAPYSPSTHPIFFLFMVFVPHSTPCLPAHTHPPPSPSFLQPRQKLPC